MEEKSGYNVLRMVKHGERFYMSSDYVEGTPLALWLKYHPCISRKQFDEWVQKIIEELSAFHCCRGNPYYQYVNPYSIIVNERREIYLLDVGSKSEEDMLHFMQRRQVREHFLSPENQYYQKMSVKEDIYGFGKMIQYILSIVQIEPALNMLEERKIKKVVEKCLEYKSEKGFSSMEDIKRKIPQGSVRKRIRKKTLLIIVIILGLIVVGVMEGERFFSTSQKRKEQYKVQQIKTSLDKKYKEQIETLKSNFIEEKEELKESYIEEKKNDSYEIACIYLLDLKDYDKAKRKIETIEDKDQFDEDFMTLCEYLLKREEEISISEYEKFLGGFEEELLEYKDERYLRCLEKGKRKLEECKEWEKVKKETVSKEGE